jgi:NADH pyrophosphatase NudC (nudix superfamily)
LVEWQGGYLLARGVAWPPGVFSFVSGFVEGAESPEAAVAREVEEELGLATRDAELIGHFPFRQLNQLIIAYRVRAVGAVSLSGELAEARTLSEAELRDFDFGPLELTRDIVHAWLKQERRVPAPN